MILAHFHSLRPRFETKQEDSLNWLIEAHALAEGNADFRKEIQEKFWRVGCKPHQIEKRGHVLSDFLHRNWDQMEIYRLTEKPSGKDLSARAEVFDREVDLIFAQYYPENALPPDDLIHVTCTGYVAPSGAQKIVSERNWGATTTVTHAYHMGCYGSIPALRMATGFLKASVDKKRADIVHTELCSLHSNPSKHQLDQLVSQSLFADGFMKYSVLCNSDQPHLKILALREEIIPNSKKAMSWNVVDWGFQMSLAKEVPILIARHLPGYLSRLCTCEHLKKAYFAIHPGGPKILSYIQQLLNLSDEQMHYSYQILKEYGNMSSATLPHIWEKICQHPDIPAHTPIISLAFGPGLTISGALLEKSC